MQTNKGLSMNLSCDRPLGDQTTVLDICDRDEQDDFLFPLTTEQSYFTRTESRRVLPFTTVVQEFPFRGPGNFGSKFQFEIGSFKGADIIFGVALQIKLSHWFPKILQNNIATGVYTYKDLSDVWHYANSMGNILIKDAELLLEDQTLEKVDGDFSNIFGMCFEDMNVQFGVATDAFGRVSIPRLKATSPKQFFPTENGWISCILPFSFQRVRLRNTFPLMSVKEGTVRINLTLRPFDECVRVSRGYRQTCNETPLGKTFTFINNSLPYYQEETYTTSTNVPEFQSIRLVTYGAVLTGELRQAMLYKPFDRLYRQVQRFSFDEPKKLAVTVSSADTVQVTLPLECNGPVEELFWFVRRKGVSANNEWTNYSAVLEAEYDPVYAPFSPLMVRGSLQINGETFIAGEENYFRRHIASNHKGGVVPYRAYLYGYSFATKLGSLNPYGWFNASRSTDVRLRLEVRPPGGVGDMDWEVAVYVVTLNWVRFENGIANKVYSS